MISVANYSVEFLIALGPYARFDHRGHLLAGSAIEGANAPGLSYLEIGGMGGWSVPALGSLKRLTHWRPKPSILIVPCLSLGPALVGEVDGIEDSVRRGVRWVEKTEGPHPALESRIGSMLSAPVAAALLQRAAKAAA